MILTDPEVTTMARTEAPLELLVGRTITAVERVTDAMHGETAAAVIHLDGGATLYVDAPTAYVDSATALGTVVLEYQGTETAAEAATRIAAALEASGAELLAAHGELVTLPGYREGVWPLVDALLTELERRITAAASHSVNVDPA